MVSRPRTPRWPSRSECRAQAARVYGVGFGVWGLGFEVWGLGLVSEPYKPDSPKTLSPKPEPQTPEAQFPPRGLLPRSCSRPYLEAYGTQ